MLRPTKPMPITLHIERIILDGIDLAPAQRPLLQAALETELERLLAEGGDLASLAAGLHVHALRAAPIRLDGTGEPAALGAQIARSVYGSFGEIAGDRPASGEEQR